MRVSGSIVAAVAGIFLSTSALADDVVVTDHPRFRGAIVGTVGSENVSVNSQSASATMFGAEGRLGVQLNNFIGIYAQPYLAFGTFGGLMGSTGTFATTFLGDLTFLDRVSVGAGIGYGYFNNPSGPVIHVRAGFYPVLGHGEDGTRRKGLVIGVDFRDFFLGQGYSSTYLITGGIGYEAF